MYRHFRVQVVLRVLLIGGTLWLALFLFFRTSSYVGAGIAGLVVIYELVLFIRYHEKTNRDLSRLLRSIQYSDFSQTFTTDRRGRAFAELSEAFRGVMDDFRAARAEKEEHYRYLHTVMQHVGTGLISFKLDGTVSLINTAAKRLLRVPHLKNVQALGALSDELVEVLLGLRYGEKALVKVMDGDELIQLAIHATEFKLRDDRYKLVSIQDIQSELEEMEIEAWQKLTRVLTHEIMNSVAPIASLASTARGMLEEVELPAPDEGTAAADALGDVRGAVRVIERRSEGLLHFVNAYRQLTRVPQPDFAIISVAELFRDLSDLLQPQIEAGGIMFETSVRPEEMDLIADRELVEQVLINLLRNALQAVADVPRPAISVEAHIDRHGRAVVRVIDNGSGIVEEAMEKIFIPFFTTKKEGSGIGLSLSREIMRQHGGTISATSEPHVRTAFTLRF